MENTRTAQHRREELMPKLVNLVSHMVNRTDQGTPYISITTALTSSPQLFYSCRNPVRITNPRRRFAENVPHGLYEWFDKVDSSFEPDICQGQTSIFLGADTCKEDDPCNFFIAQPQPGKHELDWSTPSVPCEPVDKPAYGTLFDNTGQFYNAGTGENQMFFHGNENQDPVSAGGLVIGIPASGTFSVVFGAQINFVIGNPSITLLLRDEDGNLYKQTDPYMSDGRGCSGLAGVVPRRSNKPTPTTLSLYTTAPNLGTGQWGFTAKSIFAVQWWPE